MQKVLSFILIKLFFLAQLTMAHNDYDEQGWEEAGEYLRQHMMQEKKPCDLFFDHVCGNYGKDDESKFSGITDHLWTWRKLYYKQLKELI